MPTYKVLLPVLLCTTLLITACTNTSLRPLSNAKSSHYTGEATVLIAVYGNDDREVRHIEMISDEEPEGFSVYFHDNKIGEGFIPVILPTPSTNVRLAEYSLTGIYGCSRGKDGYGYGDKVLPKLKQGKSYFLGTINTSMNTMYKEMPETLYTEAKSKYHYTPHGTDLKKKSTFQQ